MPTTLLLDLASPSYADWRAALEAAGLHRAAACGGDNLVRRTSTDSPDQIVCVADGLVAALEDAFAAWHGEPPCPVLLLTPPLAIDERVAARATELGIHHWLAFRADDGPAAIVAALAAATPLAAARHAHERALRVALVRVRAELDERKWVERAKGVLMTGRGMDEDEAFRLLRGAAMNVNLRVGEVSRAVFEAAKWADAMNRAGQLRMLSQRGVRLVAQRLLRIDVRAAATLETQSLQRMRDNLALLGQQCAGTPAAAALSTAERRFLAFAEALAAPRVDLPALLRIDQRAGELVAAAERLTEALQEAAGRRTLRIVNECGRQRLRVQRIAKDSLLAALPGLAGEAHAFAQRRDATLAEFEQALRELERAPLSSAPIRATLAEVREQWQRLVGGLRASDPDAGRRALVHASEILVERLDELTAAYEHSLQVIMG